MPRDLPANQGRAEPRVELPRVVAGFEAPELLGGNGLEDSLRDDRVAMLGCGRDQVTHLVGLEALPGDGLIDDRWLVGLSAFQEHPEQGNRLRRSGASESAAAEQRDPRL